MSQEMLYALIEAFFETLYMVGVSSFVAVLFGLPIGVILFITQKNAIVPHATINKVLGIFVNALRSIPFIILLVALIPLTRLLIGTSIGSSAAIVSLSIAAIPFIARIIENALQEVPKGLIEAGLAMGATPFQVTLKILIPEAISSIINGITLMIITLVGYSAMAGAVGGGGLGALAIRYGYERFNVTVMLITIAILIVMVQLLQWLGDILARYFNHG